MGGDLLDPAAMYPAGEVGVRSRFVQLASGLRVRVVESGAESAPPVVLVPGWGCTAWIFHETLVPLAEMGFHPIAVELKGHGFSDKPPSPSEYTTASLRDNLLEILDALGLEKTALVGHSMGAAVAAHAAAASPERVTAIVLAAPVGFAGVPGLPLFKALTPPFAIPLLPFLARRWLVRAMLRVVYGSSSRATERDVDEFWAPTQFPNFTRALRHLLHEFDWNAPFPRLDVPTMTILGTKDRLCSAKDAERYAGGAGTAQPVLIEGAGHVIFNEAHEIVNRAIADFLRGVAEPGYILNHDA